MRLSRPRSTLDWKLMVVAILAVAFAVIRLLCPKMWILWPIFFTLSWLAPGPIAAVWGFVVILRRETRLTRGRVITGKPAIALGSLAIIAGLAYAPLLIYWAIVNYPKGW